MPPQRQIDEAFALRVPTRNRGNSLLLRAGGLLLHLPPHTAKDAWTRCLQRLKHLSAGRDAACTRAESATFAASLDAEWMITGFSSVCTPVITDGTFGTVGLCHQHTPVQRDLTRAVTYHSPSPRGGGVGAQKGTHFPFVAHCTGLASFIQPVVYRACEHVRSSRWTQQYLYT